MSLLARIPRPRCRVHPAASRAVVRHDATDRYLASACAFVDSAEHALVFADEAAARAFVDRYACERAGFSVLAAPAAVGAVAAIA